MVTEEIGWMQIRVADDIWECSSLQHIPQRFQDGNCRSGKNKD